MDETRTNIERVSHGGAQLVGAVFNQPNAGGFRGNWLRSWSKPLVNGVLLGWLCMMVSEVRGATNEAPTQTNRLAALSVVSPSQMAVWQKRFTLGPGDILDVSIYGQPDTLRKELTIGPDGRMNYLQARDVMVSGLTVEELRGKLEETLGQFYRPPFRIMVLPRAYHSKKYYLLGNVRQRGAFALNQPLTILEAIARAEGFLVNADARHTLMLADVSRSFLIRKEEDGQFKRMNINFEDLFLRGDLSQNVTLAPEDYLFFPALDVQEVYVLGEVVRPGVATYVPGTSLMRALVSAGGFKEKAYRSKVLVVRGSLNQPQPIVINVNDVLEARAPDHKLEPRDIIYVSRRPWAKAEDLLELAVTEFLRAAIITWTGQNVGPIIKDPWFD